MPAKRRTPNKFVKLSVAQVEIVGQFNDYAHEYPRLSFDEVAREEFGPKPFPNTPKCRESRRECKSVFDLERKLSPHPSSSRSV